MQLRSNYRSIGYYTEKEIPEDVENQSCQINELKRPLEMDLLIGNISFLITKQLKKPKSIITLRLDITNKTRNFLEKKYNLTKRFKHIPDFFNENIRTSLSTNEQIRNEIIKETFKIKFANERKFKFIENNKENFLTYGPQVVIELKKKRIFNINQNMRNMLNNI